MHLSTIEGNFNQQDFFIFVACDHQYFDDFAISLVNSVRKNTHAGVHLHVFNPTQCQLSHFRHDSKVSLTYEFVNTEHFAKSLENLEQLSFNTIEKYKFDRTVNAAQKGQDIALIDRIMKTYYACARFVRLAEIIQDPREFFAIDIDAIVRQPISKPTGDSDFYIHHIDGKDPRFLAGGLYFSNSNQSLNFLNDYGLALKTEIERDNLYWSLDQDLLNKIVPKYKYGVLPISYIDWNMRSDSCIWTAKGKRKDLEIFKTEQNRYRS